MTKMPRPTHQPPGVYHQAVGDTTITALNDGVLQAAFEYLTHIPSNEAEALHHASFRAIPPRITISCFLVQTDDRLILVDSGCGSAMGPSLGALSANLRALGVQAGDIDMVLATHLHPDHIGGLVDSNGAALFPKAELVVHEAELRFWGDDATLAHATTDQDRGFVQIARAAIAAYRDRTRPLIGGEALPGISLVPEPGHTPGHSGWLITSGAESLLIWGDIVHMPGVQFPRPGAGMGFDIDGDQAIETRRRIFDMVATDRLTVAGMHLDFPCFGHVARAVEGYAFIPSVWTPSVGE
jgi:glyoxylase-like metal-dependent hydrolase (beta-lactamase superfamily II)